MRPRSHWDRPYPTGAPPALNSWLSGSWPTLAAVQGIRLNQGGSFRWALSQHCSEARREVVLAT